MLRPGHVHPVFVPASRWWRVELPRDSPDSAATQRRTYGTYGTIMLGNLTLSMAGTCGRGAMALLPVSLERQTEITWPWYIPALQDDWRAKTSGKFWDPVWCSWLAGYLQETPQPYPPPPHHHRRRRRRHRHRHHHHRYLDLHREHQRQHHRNRQYQRTHQCWSNTYSTTIDFPPAAPAATREATENNGKQKPQAMLYGQWPTHFNKEIFKHLPPEEVLMRPW